ncbi:ATP-dependent zinc metalloprotease FtsH [Clostridia bacterium]|nr:ATP-dependent zinc metalloprotease FtsH [Clostridia bacterium]
MGKNTKNITFFLLLALLLFTMLRINMGSTPEVSELTYNEFSNLVESGQVEEVSLEVEDGSMVDITGTMDDGSNFILTAVQWDNMSEWLLENDVQITKSAIKEDPWWLGMIGYLLPIALLIGMLVFMSQQAQGGNKAMQFGKSKAKLQNEMTKKVTFKDVAGCDEVKEELEEIIEFLKSPEKFTKLGAKIPKGVLLFGAPGTGKTLLAKAVAGEADVPFFTISGSDFVEMFVGVGASRVRDLFEQAKKSSPCIIFIDEIDAVGRQRGAGLGGGHDEREQTLNQLLVEMDGFETNEGIIIIAATNRPDILDPALLRPGRFDRQVTVGAPDVRGREEILQVHSKGKPLAEGVDLSVLAKRTPGFTGADLANLMNEGALLTARKNGLRIGMEELESSIERIIAGPEKHSKIMSEKEKKLVAYHEAGHAVTSHYLPNTDPLHKVSIIPRGAAGGYTLLLPEEDRNYITKEQMFEQVCMLLGGRIAESLVLDDISTGASNDLERATGTIRSMITEYGMSEELGSMTFGNKADHQVFLGRDISRERNYSEEIAYNIDKEAKRWMDNCYKRTETILREHMDKLVLLADSLMERETIDAEEFILLMEKGELAESAIENKEVVEEAKEDKKDERALDLETGLNA